MSDFDVIRTHVEILGVKDSQSLVLCLKELGISDTWPVLQAAATAKLEAMK